MTTHIDEGTIHAWLDGALDAERARAVEEHVRQCARCGEAVAEARGLVAASSRILGALDDVPAGVIPKQAPVKKHKRVWRAAPWVTGIAAVLMAAVVLRISDEPARFDQPMTAVSPTSTAPVVDSAVELPQANQVAAAPPAVAAPTTSIGPAQPVASVPRPTRTARASVGSVSGSSVAAGAAAADLASAEDASRARAAADEESARRTASAGAREAQRQRAEAPAAPAVVADLPAPRPSSLLDMRAVRPIDPVRDTVPDHAGLAGCYVVTMPPRPVAQEYSAMRTRTDARRVAPSAAAAAAPEMKGSAIRVVVRLDSLAGRPGYIVRAAGSDSSLGWWNRINADSARVDLLTLGVTLVAGKDRIVCPER
jgi:hypothetical protein